MRRLICMALAAGALALAPSFAPGGGSALAAAARDPVSLNGVWWPLQPEGFEFKPDPVLTPAAQAVWNEIRGSMDRGLVVQDSTAACVPPGTPRLMTRVYPIQWIRYDKGYVLIHEFENDVRWLYMDGRKAPTGEDVIPTFNGYSVGRWEGDALVVETTGFKPQSESGWPVWIQMGVKVTPQLKLVERYRLTNGGKGLEVQMTMTDPGTFAKPWETTKRFELRSDVDIMEYTCLPDENPVTFKADGSTAFKALTPAP